MGDIVISIAGTGSFLPEHVVTTEVIGALVERYAPSKGAAWALEKLGVGQRRFATPLDPITGFPVGEADELALATHAASAALERAGVSAAELSGLWYVSCTQSDGHRHFSGLAFALHAQLGLRPEAFALEMDAGCGGAVHAIATAVAQMRGADLDAVLIVAANLPSQYFRHWPAYAESGAWLSMYLFGDGAGAVVLQKSSFTDGQSGILAAYTANDPANPLMTYGRPAGQVDPVYLIDGRGVALGFRGYARAALEALRCRYAFEFHDVQRFYFHQVNAVVLRNFVRDVDIPEHKVAMHVDRYGNLAAAATLVLLDEDVGNGVVHSGDLCVVCTVGAGAQYGAILVRM